MPHHNFCPLLGVMRVHNLEVLTYKLCRESNCALLLHVPIPESVWGDSTLDLDTGKDMGWDILDHTTSCGHDIVYITIVIMLIY